MSKRAIEPRIIDYFRTAPLEAARVTLAFAQQAVKERSRLETPAVRGLVGMEQGSAKLGRKRALGTPAPAPPVDGRQEVSAT